VSQGLLSAETDRLAHRLVGVVVVRLFAVHHSNAVVDDGGRCYDPAMGERAQLGVVGQDRVLGALRSALATDRLAHGLLFVGPDGVGREKTARLLARGLLCDRRGTGDDAIPFGCGECRACRRAEAGTHPDLRVVMSEAEAVARGLASPDGKARPSAEIKIDAVRELGLSLLRRPYEGKASIAIIVDAHRMNDKAQNALLKVLEEPAPTTVLILLVPGVRAVLPTIASRCLRLAFAPLDERAVTTILSHLGAQDAVDRARRGDGSVRAALDDGAGGLGAAVDALRHGLWLKQRGEHLGERLQIAESLGKDRLEVEAVLAAVERTLAVALRQRGGVLVPQALDEVTSLDALAQARADLRKNGAVQLVVERLLCGAAPSVLEQRR
jgi:DNA polymerase-3 subunit delta'